MTRLTDEELERMAVANEQLFWTPNQASMRLLIAELRALRLTAEEREALVWAAWMCCGGEKPRGGDYQEAVPRIRAVLARLVGEK